MLHHILMVVVFLAAFPPLTSLAATNDNKLFIGTWCGQWDGGTQNRLTVKRVINGGVASGTYAWGTPPNDYRVEYKGKITDGVLNIEFFGGKLKISYRLADNDTLIGKWKKSFKTLTITSKWCP